MPTLPPSIHKKSVARRERERKIELDRKRGTRTARGYDYQWGKVRSSYIKANPMCEFCSEDGLLQEAQVVDHIVPISEAPELRLDPDNLRSLCKRCHDRRTALEQGFAKTNTRPVQK